LQFVFSDIASEGSDSVFEWSDIVSEGSCMVFGHSDIASEGSDSVFGCSDIATEGSDSMFEWSDIVSKGSCMVFGISDIASEGSYIAECSLEVLHVTSSASSLTKYLSNDSILWLHNSPAYSYYAYHTAPHLRGNTLPFLGLLSHLPEFGREQSLNAF